MKVVSQQEHQMSSGARQWLLTHATSQSPSTTDGWTDGRRPTGVVTSGFFVILFGVARLVPPPACCLRKLRFCVAPPVRLSVRPLAAAPACTAGVVLMLLFFLFFFQVVSLCSTGEID
ncbi:unnamed protein product [Sphagnum tenellum]